MSTFRKDLQKALKKIDRPGMFCVSGSMPLVLPGLTIEGIDPVGLPLNASQAKEVIKHCEQAPFGKGEQTLTDTNVRKVWHMKPDKFSLTNPDWNGLLEQILTKVKGGLGLEKENLEAHLYDLLLYEPGSFFLSHRDSEKLERMVATLVVVLPSSFKGGELVVRHDGQERVIDAAEDAAKFRVHYSAFYADCEHEIRPLREGYRIALVYNLVLAKSKKSKQSIEAPRGSEHIAPIRDILRGWAEADDVPEKLAITLDHRYTPDGLLWDALKGVDRARADILLEAARQANWHVHLAMVTFHQSGSTDEMYEDWGYDEDDENDYDEEEEDEDEDGDTEGDYTMDEVFDEDLCAANWSTPSGERVDFGEMSLDEEEILDYKLIQTVKPEEEYEGYTGNEGTTLDRWYRHGAVVIWPEAMDLNITCGSGVKPTAEVLANMVELYKRPGIEDADTIKTRCVAFANDLLNQWAENTFDSYDDEEAECGVLPSLAQLEEVGLLRRYVGEVLKKDATLKPGKQLAKVCQAHGWATFQSELEAVFRATNSKSIERNFDILGHFREAKPAKKANDWQSVCEKLGEHAVRAFEKLDVGVATTDWQHRQIERERLLATLPGFLVAINRPELLTRVVDLILKDTTNYPLAKHIGALESLKPWLAKNVKAKNAPLSRWVAEVRKQLETLTAEMPQPPKDFRRTSALSCSCKHCGPVAKFLDSPKESTFRLSAVQLDRDHVEHNLKRAEADVTMTTEKQRRPYVLVCTKNQASYQRTLKKYHEDLEHLAAMRAIEQALPG